MEMQNYHDPVLLMPTVDGLNIHPNGVYVDVTFGGGGHSREILKRLSEKGRLYAFDQDEDAVANAKAINDSRLVLIQENFRFIKRFLRFHGVKKVDGILADFGVSSHQFDEASRGFSTRFNSKLDMRMNQEAPLSAYEVVNEYSEEDIASVLYMYGELRASRGIAAAIVKQRAIKKIENTQELIDVLGKFLPKNKTHKILAQVFQAIRIEVNQELEALKELLWQSVELLNIGGRLSLISYHSLEDRLVKRFIKNGQFEGEPERDIFGRYEVPLRSIGKLIVPTEEEIERNNRARSAKLRIAERK